MTLDTMLTLLAFTIYLLAMLCIGFITMSGNKSSKDYFLGGHKAGPWLTALSAEASDMSSWLLMGVPGVAYMTGCKGEAFWTVLGLLAGTYLNWKIVAKRLRTYAIQAGDAITIPEFLSNRVHDTSGRIKAIGAVMIILFFVIYTASGFVACGKLFRSVFGMSYYTGLVIGILVIVGYTLTGGYMAVVTTDFIQGSLMFFALVVTMVLGFNEAGPRIGEVQDMLNPFVNADYDILSIISLMAWGLGYFGMPHILVRFMGIKSNEELPAARRIAMVWVTVSMAVAMVIGVLAHVTLPVQYASQTAAENAFIDQAKIFFPTFLAGVFLCAVLASSMSTADSQLLVASSAFAEDIYKTFIHKTASEKEVLAVSRIGIIAITVVAVFLALDPDSSVFSIVSYAWAGFGATFGPCILASIFWKRTSRRGIIAGMVAGGLTIILWRQLSGGLFDLYELLPGFIAGSIMLVLFSLSEKPDKQVMEEFEAFKASL